MMTNSADLRARILDLSPNRVALLALELQERLDQEREARREATAPVGTAPRGAIPGVRLSAAVPIFETVLTPREPSFLDQHRFRGTPILPGPLFAELGRRAAIAAGLPGTAVRDLEIRSALDVPNDGVRVQTVIEHGAAGARFRVFSGRNAGRAGAVRDVSGADAAGPDGIARGTDHDSGDGVEWVEHATGLISNTAVTGGPADSAPLAVPPGGFTRVDVQAHLALAARLGFGLGPDATLYDGIEIARRHGRATLRQPAPGTPPPVAAALLVDAGMQLLGAISAATDARKARILTSIRRIDYLGDPLAAATATAKLRPGENGAMLGDVDLFDASGHLIVRVRDATLDVVSTMSAPNLSWFHELVWRQIADTSGGFASTDMESAIGAVNAAWPRLAATTGLADYVDWLPSLRDRAAGHAWWALRRLGMPAVGEVGSAEGLVERLGIAPRYHRLVPRLLEVLGEAGALRREGDGWRAVAAPPWAVGDAPGGCAPVMDLVDRCGTVLDGILTGAVDPLTILFPDAGADLTRAIYRTTPFGLAFNGAIHAAVRALVSDRHTDPPLRVLEIGAGFGSTTESVLAALDGRPAFYTFTDLAPTLVDLARRNIAPREGLDFRVLDIERDPVEQGFDAGGYDLVVAANTLRSTADLGAAVRNAASLLGPGGILLLLQGTRPEPWVDLTFGLTQGWWRFRDHALRPDHPLIAVDDWSALLADTGFAEVVALPADELAENAGQVLLLARRPAIDASGRDNAVVGNRVHDARANRNPAALVAAMREVADGEGERLWVITENAQAVGANDSPDPDSAALWGLGRTFALEHPDRWGGLIDLEAGTDETRARRQVEVGIANPADDQMAFRGNIRHRPRLIQAAPPVGAELTIADGNFLVTGGMGGLGLHVVRWLAESGAGRVVLVGRSADPADWAADDPRQARLEALGALPTEIMLRSVDIADPDAVRELMAEIDTDDMPLRGIFHAAAVFDETPLVDLTKERYNQLMRPKALGARNLIEAMRGRDPDFIVLFSSTAALLGVAGLGSYAAANLYLDALAARARLEGVPVLSVNWGLWSQMRRGQTEDAIRYEPSGLKPMPHEAALDAMARAIGAGASNAVIASVDWERLRSVYEARRPRPILAELMP